MKQSVRRAWLILLIAIWTLVAACTPLKRTLAPLTISPDAPLAFSPDEQIAGEIMAYLIEVVLGLAGDPSNRQAWAQRGHDLPLDFTMVTQRMFGPIPLRTELMVLDTNILGLSRVLYHYDRKLNLFKGSREHDSLYPCAELMAIRLLLLQKRQTNQTVSIAAITRHLALFSASSQEAGSAELSAMGLTADEFRYLKAIFQSEPAFLRYLRHPFIVSTLRRIGVARNDAFTLAADLAANYDQLACPPVHEAQQGVTVAIVPAMILQSTPPTKEEKHLTEAIRASITAQVQERSPGQIEAGRLHFFIPARPLTVHPDNVDRVMAQLCPAADFTVILLGKNVYRTVHIDPDRDIHPHKPVLYLDVDDVRYNQMDYEMETVANALLAVLQRHALSARHPAGP